MTEKYSKLNESSIVDLKAEMYKKEMEAEMKGFGKSSEGIIHRKSKTLQKIAENTGRYKLKLSNQTKEHLMISEEETRKLEEVSEKLSAKSKLYEKLKSDAIKGVRHENLEDAGILVDFDRKANEKQIEQASFSDVIQSAEAFHREKMNVKWEEDRRKLEEKPVGQEHYQDVLFNELRQHGVGYYQFSSDEIERTKQLTQLETLRKETVITRQKNLEIQEKREKKMKDRIDKIRARRGLSPLKESISTPEVIQVSRPETIDDQIEDIIEKSRVDKLYKNIVKKIEVRTLIPEEERNFDFAPPLSYSRSRKYNRK